MEKRFKELSNEYFNAGGNCMVDITTLYDFKRGMTIYMLVNDEYMILTTYDYVRNDIPDDMVDADFILYSIATNAFTTEPGPANTDMLEMPEEYFTLFDYGKLSFIRNTAEHSGKSFLTTVDALPTILHRMVPDDYAEWLSDNMQLVATDGKQIIFDEQYLTTQYDNNGRAAVALNKILDNMMPTCSVDDDIQPWDEFYNSKIQIIINDTILTFDMSAGVYAALEDLAKYVISEQ